MKNNDFFSSFLPSQSGIYSVNFDGSRYSYSCRLLFLRRDGSNFVYSFFVYFDNSLCFKVDFEVSSRYVKTLDISYFNPNNMKFRPDELIRFVPWFMSKFKTPQIWLCKFRLACIKLIDEFFLCA